MSSEFIVAVTQRVDLITGRKELRDAIDQRLIAWIQSFGGQPVPVPNCLGKNINPWIRRILPTAIILSGGNDIGTNPERDRTESALLEYSKLNGVPTLGICRGMQFMVRYCGGTLVPVTEHAGTHHALERYENSHDFPDVVNSFHNFGVGDCPSDFYIMATARDGVIEAVRHKKYKWSGWMWHPERDEVFCKLQLKLARQILLEC